MVIRYLPRSPAILNCPRCAGKLSIDLNWYPDKGFDSTMRRYHHPPDSENDWCSYFIFRLTHSLKDVPTDVLL